MKIKKIILLIPVIFLFISGLCYSQNNDINKTPEARARQITDRLNEKLSFKDGQDSLVFNAYQSFFSSMEMLKNFKDDNDETKKAMDNARNELDGKMKYILSAEQYDKYSDMVKDMQKNNQKRRNKHDMNRKNKD